MATLHLVNASCDSSAALQNCLTAAAPGDTILLIANGVFCAMTATFKRHARPAAALSWCASLDDVRSRGIERLLDDSIALLDDHAFVDLVSAHQPIVSWS